MRKFLKNKNNILAHGSMTDGFTLVETLVAISIFTMSLLGLMSVLASGISNTTYAKQKMVASYLAQEGIESVRNMRDTAVLYNATDPQHGWDAFKASLTSALCGGVGCYINNMVLFGCNIAGICPNLSYDSTTGVYGYSSGADSGFSRKIKFIQLNPPANGDEIKVTSIVSWKQGSSNSSVTFSEDLFNWVE